MGCRPSFRHHPPDLHVMARQTFRCLAFSASSVTHFSGGGPRYTPPTAGCAPSMQLRRQSVSVGTGQGCFCVHRSFSVQRPFRERSLGVAPLLRPLSEGLIPARQGALQASKEGDIAWPGGVHLPRLDSVQEPLERFGGLLDSCLGWGTARGCHDPHILHRSHDEKGEWVERAEVPWAMMGP